jgi:hypothetical protein
MAFGPLPRQGAGLSAVTGPVEICLSLVGRGVQDLTGFRLNPSANVLTLPSGRPNAPVGQEVNDSW